jgi:Tfp pilus assembly protein PilO
VLPVSEATQSVLQRVIAEHRRAVFALISGVIINLLVFAFVVYPLQSDVANVEQRTKAAEADLAAAQAEFGRANGALTGRDRALKELDTFYRSVLAQDLTGARRLTFSRLAQLAAQSDLDFERRQYEPVIERGSNLTRLKVSMELAGDYDNVRDFIYAIESSPEFVIIDQVTLMDSADVLRLSLQLSCYFWCSSSWASRLSCGASDPSPASTPLRPFVVRGAHRRHDRAIPLVTSGSSRSSTATTRRRAPAATCFSFSRDGRKHPSRHRLAPRSRSTAPHLRRSGRRRHHRYLCATSATSISLGRWRESRC